MKMLQLISCVVFLFSIGCVSVSTMQTARPIKPGTATFAGSAGYQSLSVANSALGTNASAANSIENLDVMHMEYMIQYGIHKNLSITGKLSIPRGYGFDLKYTFINGENLAMASGLKLGYGTIRSESESETDLEAGPYSTDYRIFDLAVPLLVSYDLGERVTAYISPQAISRTTNAHIDYQSDEFTDKKAAGQNLLGGSNFGLVLDWLIVEMSYFVDVSDSNIEIWQFTVGFWYGWENLDLPES